MKWFPENSFEIVLYCCDFSKDLLLPEKLCSSTKTLPIEGILIPKVRNLFLALGAGIINHLLGVADKKGLVLMVFHVQLLLPAAPGKYE